MLNSLHEYEKMARVEREFWWYRALHGLCLDALGQTNLKKDGTIIDAGCGTGGLLWLLKEHGYCNASGFDLSPVAVEICRGRGLEVSKDHLLNTTRRFAHSSLEVLISNDTLCYFNATEGDELINQFGMVLKPGGLLLMNVPALSGFRGIHDLSVGIRHRFTPIDLQRLFDRSLLKVLRLVYWPFVLSPAVFLARFFQRLKLSVEPDTAIRSDIDPPHPLVNKLLESITVMENRHLKKKPFGSSIFVVCARSPLQQNRGTERVRTS
jgi:SAM-dependent methyltransferase